MRIEKININDTDKIYDTYRNKEIRKENIAPGNVISVFDGEVYQKYLVHNVKANGIFGYPIDCEVVADVYLWNSKDHVFKAEPIFTGDPEKLLDDDNDLINEGDVIFVAKKGTQEPLIIEGDWPDPTGVYILSVLPHEFNGMVDDEECSCQHHEDEADDDEDEYNDLAFVPVHSIASYYATYENNINDMIEFMNTMIDKYYQE